VAQGRQAWCVTGNLADVADIRAIGVALRASVPRLDVLVNNAGVFPAARFEDVTPDMWDETHAVNTRSMFFLAQECAPLLRAAGGCIVNMASAGGRAPWSMHIPYNVSKAGVIMLTRALAKALAPDVRVNAIAPGIILVPGEESIEHIPAARFPLARHGTIEDLTQAVRFLIEARYLTGHVLPLDGGQADIRGGG
jgi:pteridine reductase